jgi:hypothetical protein
MRKQRVFIVDNDAKSLVNIQEQIESQWGNNVSISIFHSPRAVLTHLIKEQAYQVEVPTFIYVNLPVEDQLSSGFMQDLRVFEIQVDTKSILFSNQLPHVQQTKLSAKRRKITNNLLQPLHQKHIQQ